MMKTLLLWGVLFCTLTFGDVRFAEPAPTIDKPREVVMGISGGDDESIHHALSTANNVLKFYGPEKIHLRVVAYYHGIRTLLKSEKEIAVRVRALQQYGESSSPAAIRWRRKKSLHRPSSRMSKSFRQGSPK